MLDDPVSSGRSGDVVYDSGNYQPVISSCKELDLVTRFQGGAIDARWESRCQVLGREQSRDRVIA